MVRSVFRAIGRRGLLLSVVISLAVVGSGPTAAQTPLRVTHSVDKTGPTHTELSGSVFNDGTVDVIDVYVNAAAIDGSGKVLAQGIPYVGSVPARGSTPFKARVPSVPGATSYRVRINSFRFQMGRTESP